MNGVIIETYGQQIALEFPSFFEELAQSDIFNSPGEILNFSNEVKFIIEENVFSKSNHWQNLKGGNRNWNGGRNPHQNVDMIRQEILEYFENTQYEQFSRGGGGGQRSSRAGFNSQRVPMSMRAGGPQKYNNVMDDESEQDPKTTYGQARQDFQFVSKFLQTEVFVIYVMSL